MAASQSKKKTGASSGGKRTAPAQKKGKSRKAAPSKSNPQPLVTEIGGVICVLLAFFAGIGYFNTDGFFIKLFRNLLFGLLGWGGWLVPPALLLGAYILLFHKGRPVKQRLTCTLLIPVLVGSLFHLFCSQQTYHWDATLLSTLWVDGQAMLSGGALSGFLAEAFSAAFSKIGAGFVFFLTLALALLVAFQRTLEEVVKAIHDWFAEYQDMQAERLEQIYATASEPEPPAPKPKYRKIPDLPVEDGPLLNQTKKKSAEPVNTVRRKNLFDRTSSVPAPDQVIAGIPFVPQIETPEYEDRSNITPVLETEPEIKSASESELDLPTVSVPPAASATPISTEPIPSEPTPWEPEEAAIPSESIQLEPEEAQIPSDPIPPVPDPWKIEETPSPIQEVPFIIPEIIREPAVPKLRPEETAQTAIEITQEIENTTVPDKYSYRYPPLSLLNEGNGNMHAQGQNELVSTQVRLDDTLQSFGVEAHIVNVTRGPSVTRYELELEQGVKLNKITNLADDIALALGASSVRIAPIPDKISTVGIEVPNKHLESVAIRDVIGSRQFTDSSSKVSFAVGKDISGQPVVGNIAKLPHMLIAGTTGSGKSVCTNSLIISLLYKSTPEEVRLIMVDPKMVELNVYNGIPHLLIPVVTDPKKAAGALQWAVNEMMKRYRMFSEVGAKDLASYNNHARKREDLEALPQVVVVIDELADLMLVAAKEVEESICRVAQMGRASGMHLVIATQRPSADVITGLMKANIPSRIAFAVASSLESRIILDQTGAEKLVGKGDMLYFPLGSGKPQRVQGCFISEEEVADVVAFIKENGTAQYDESVLHEIEQHAEEKEKSARGVGGNSDNSDYDELLPDAIDVVLDAGQASVSMLQRRLKLGYGRAARLIDQMEEIGVVGPFEGSKPRQLLITKAQWQEMQFRRNMVSGTAVSNSVPAFEPVPEEFPYEGDAIEQERNTMPF